MKERAALGGRKEGGKNATSPVYEGFHFFCPSRIEQ